MTRTEVDNDGRTTSETVETQDARGHTLRHEFRYSADSKAEIQTWEYELDSVENWTKKSCVYVSDARPLVTRRVITYWD